MSVDRSLRRRCQELIRGLDEDGVIPDPFDLAEFTFRLERHRGRCIHLIPAPAAMGESPCGLWIKTGNTDFVFYAANTTPLHKCHIVLHEFGHLAFDHDTGGIQGADLAQLLAPDLDPRMIKRMLGRSAYDDPAEAEAETFADLLLAPRVLAPGIQRLPPRSDLPLDIAEVLANLEHAWGQG